MTTNEQFIQLVFIGGSVLLMIPLLRLGAFVLGLPLRRRENSRLFLEFLTQGLRDGRRAEEIFLSLARTGDRTLEFLSTPRTPRVLGIAHISLGILGVVFALIDLSAYFSNHGFHGIESLGDALVEMHLMALVIIVSGFYIWAGVQLIRYRVSGRWLAIGLAGVDVVLLTIVPVAVFFTGAFAGLVPALAGYIIPGVIIYLLTKPEVVAVCGRNGKQEPLLVTRLREMDLMQALRQAPGLIEPRIVSLLAVGRELGDLQKVLPACRTVLGEATDKVRSVQNNFVLMTFVVMPMSLVFLPFLAIYVIPKFKMIIAEMTGSPTLPGLFGWLSENAWWLIGIHAFVLLGLWGFALVMLAGSRFQEGFTRWFPVLSARLSLLLPWGRKRAQRDFSVSLSLLLDAGLPEARAVELAAESTGNQIFQNRAARVGEDLANGMPLPEAVGRIDGAGEFQWRLTTAARAGQGFLPALRAWHEALDARAAQQEQTAAQMATAGLVFYNGAIVGMVMISVFQVFINIMDVAALW